MYTLHGDGKKKEFALPIFLFSFLGKSVCCACPLVLLTVSESVAIWCMGYVQHRGRRGHGFERAQIVFSYSLDLCWQ